MTPAEVLAGARDVLAERGWGQGAGAVTRGGVVCLGIACSVAAAAQPAADGVLLSALDAVSDVIGVKRGSTGAIFTWNDAPERTYEDIQIALKEAEQLALAAEAQS